MKILFGILILTIILYSVFLNRTPIHLNQDELGFALNAYSISQTGQDENGRIFPLYFWHLDQMWATPILVYLTAIFLKVLPLSENTIRLAAVFVGVINILLVYLLAKKIFENHYLSILCAFLLILTPAHFIHSRLLMDTNIVVPFILGWLLLLLKFIEKKQIKYLVFSLLCLGIGVHSYHAAKVIMPFYFLMSIFLLKQNRLLNKKIFGIAIFAFALPIVPLIPWLLKYPDTLTDQVKYTGIYDKSLNPLQGLLTLFTPDSIIKRLSVYISFFSPTFLFWHGDQSIVHSTWKNGVFLVPLLVFIPVGIFKILKSKKDQMILFLFLTAPLATVVAGDHYRISRSLVLLPFGVILAVFGIKYLWQSKFKLFCLLLLIAIPLQFAYFLYDYLTDYRISSYKAMRYNLPGALEKVIAYSNSTNVNKIYFDNRIDLIQKYWKFYLIKENALNLENKTDYIDVKTVNLESLEKNTLILYSFNNIDGLKNEIEDYKKIDTVFEPDGTSSFYIFKK